MDDQLLNDLQERFEVGVLRLIERDQGIDLRRGRINGEKTSPAIYKAVRRRLLEMAGLPVRPSPTRRRGHIHLKIGEAERVLRVVRRDMGVLEVGVAVDVVKPAEEQIRAVAKCSGFWARVIGPVIEKFCCGGHCARGAYTIPCEPGGVFTA